MLLAVISMDSFLNRGSEITRQAAGQSACFKTSGKSFQRLADAKR